LAEVLAVLVRRRRGALDREVHADARRLVLRQKLGEPTGAVDRLHRAASVQIGGPLHSITSDRREQRAFGQPQRPTMNAKTPRPPRRNVKNTKMEDGGWPADTLLYIL